MREIKFRAWSTGQQKMLDDICTWTDDFTDMLNSTIDWLQSDSPDDGAYILMQYTGLKDKNGKEIYEGDVICHVTDEVVEYIGGYPRTEPEGEIIVVTIPGFFQMQDDIDLSETEVIGNIYENPELLEVSK